MVKRETNVMHMDHGRQKKLQNGQHLLTKDDFLSLQKRQTVAEDYIAVVSLSELLYILCEKQIFNSLMNISARLGYYWREV